MKILIVCAQGLSTSILMKKVRKYVQDTGKDITINAVGVIDVDEVWRKYDCILMAPQIRNHFKEIKKSVNIPVASILPQDYGIGNAENIIKLAESIIK